MARPPQEDELAELKADAAALTRSADQILETIDRIERIESDQELPANPGDEPPLGFIHIPKTAGATVTTMFIAAYSRRGVHNAGNVMRNSDRTTLKLAGFNEQRVSVGHVPFALFREHLPPETRYMTFMREPVDRVLSHYHRHIHRPNQNPRRRRGAKERKGKGTGKRLSADSIEQALVEMRVPRLRNLATRFLCDDPTAGELPETALAEAKANLRGFAFVGLQERFDESIALLRRWLGLGTVPFENRHVSSDRPAVAEISDADRELILEHNALDAELYELAVELFEEAVAAAGPGFDDEVSALRGASAAGAGVG